MFAKGCESGLAIIDGIKLNKESVILVLTRKRGEQILIGDNIELTFLGLGSHNEMRVGITAPTSVHILRGEIAEKYANKLSPESEEEKKVPVITKKNKVKAWRTSR